MTTKEEKAKPSSAETVRRVIRVLEGLENDDERVRVVRALHDLYTPQSGVRREV